MVKTSFLVDIPFDIVVAAFQDEEARKKMFGDNPNKIKLGKTKIDDRITKTESRSTFNMHIPFMSDREMLLKTISYYPYSKDDFLEYSSNTTHKDYPVDKNLVRCNVHYMATYAKKEGDKTKFYRLSHFNMEISMMNKFAGGSAAIKKTREFIDGLKVACDMMKKKGK